MLQDRRQFQPLSLGQHEAVDACTVIVEEHCP